MDYVEALDLLYARSDPERGPGFWTGGGDPTMGPERTRAMLAEAGEPQEKVSCFHVAGSTGKGTTCLYLAAALRQLGLRTGLYTQPHLHSYRERIQLGTEPIPASEFAAGFERALDYECIYRRRGPDLGPATTFELTTVMAFDWFARRGARFAVVETGLGGRLDATNVISAPDCVLLTPIGLEHTQILGHELGQIAAEKAAIIKPGGAVACAPQPRAAAAIIADRCRQQGAQLEFLGPAEIESARRRIPASHLAASAALAVLGLSQAAIIASPGSVLDGLAKASLPARCEVFAGPPLLLVDGGHTVHAMECLAAFIGERFRNRSVQLVFGCSADKPASELLGAWSGRIAGLHLCAAQHPRAAAAEELAAAAPFAHGRIHADVESALAGARAAAGPEAVIVATGSMYVAAAARAQAPGFGATPEPIPAAPLP